VLDRAGAHFLTADGTPRRSGAIHPYKGERDFPSIELARQHRTAVFQVAPQVERVLSIFARDLNVVLARGIKQMFAVALTQYRAALDERSVLDFSDVLQRALTLLRQMDEFSQSRFRLESRYHHVLVDEFQDTSRAQWELVSLLIQSWGEGLGLSTNPSIFIVGDRKQSIYRFRDAEVAVLQEAGRYIDGIRPGGNPRRSITRSFRALQREVAASDREARPAWLAEAYRAMNQPLLKYYNILTANTRMFVLAVAVCVDRPLLYLGFEIVFLNALLAWVSSVQNQNNERLLDEVRGAGTSERP